MFEGILYVWKSNICVGNPVFPLISLGHGSWKPSDSSEVLKRSPHSPD